MFREITGLHLYFVNYFVTNLKNTHHLERNPEGISANKLF